MNSRHFYILIGLCFFSGLKAQENHFDLPKLNAKEYGYKQPIKQAFMVFYKVDSISYAPKMVEMYSFNEEQKITQKVIQYLGKTPTQIIYNYVYKDGLLDSLNTINTNVADNSATHFIYNQKKQLIKEVCVARYGNDVKDYSYNSNRKLTKIEFTRRTNRKIITNFVYDADQLDYVEQIAPNGTQPDRKSRFYYFNGKALASTILGTKQVILYQYDFGENRQAFDGDIVEVVNSFRNNLPGEKKFLKGSHVFFQTHDATNEEGDWTKRYQADNRYPSDPSRFIFRRIIYADGTVSGNTDYDFFFRSRLKKWHKIE